MTIYAAIWTDYGIYFRVRCTCGHSFEHWSHYSLMRCPKCGTEKYFHDFNGSDQKKVAQVELAA